MTTIDTSFWDNDLDPIPRLAYHDKKINDDYTLRTPILTVDLVTQVLEKTKANQDEYNTQHSLPDVFDAITTLATRWTTPDDPRRILASRLLPHITGFSQPMIDKWGFDVFLRTLAASNLPLGRLDSTRFHHFTPTPNGYMKAYPETQPAYNNEHPALIGHICAGNILGLPAAEMILDKLAQAATWIKPSSDEPVFASLFARSLHDIDPELASTIAILPFDSSNIPLQHCLFASSSLVRAIGSETARHALTQTAQTHKTPLAGHWHKFSCIAIARDYLPAQIEELANLAALDVSAWDQQGCFSPQVIFLERHPTVTPRIFAQLLAKAMEHTSTVLPKGAKTGKLQVLEGYQEAVKRRLLNVPVEIFPSPKHEWLVILDESTSPIDISPLFRSISIRPVDQLEDIHLLLKPLSHYLQTIGVAIPQSRLIPFADAITEAGATNIRALGTMTIQQPWEPWDGHFPLDELFQDDGIRWASIGFKDMDTALHESHARYQSLAI